MELSLMCRPGAFTMWELQVLHKVAGTVGVRPGACRKALIEAAIRADADNTENLRKGFPELVAAVEAWRHGDLRQRAEAEWPDRDI